MDVVLSIMVLAAIALVGGAVWLWRNGGSKKQITLMLFLAAIIGGNVAIWTMPGPQGHVPVSAELR